MSTLGRKNQSKPAQSVGSQAAGGQIRKTPSKSPPIKQKVVEEMDFSLMTTPDTSKRKLDQVDPASPDAPLTEGKLRQIMVEMMTPLNEKISMMSSTLTDLQESQEATQKAEEKKSSLLEAKVEKLESQNTNLNAQMSSLERENFLMKKQLLNMETQSRRNNLRFHGLPESKIENCELIVHQYLTSKGFQERPDAFERAHRMGPKIAGKIRPIIVRFQRFKDRQAVWGRLGHKLFPKPHNEAHVREDYPREVDDNRATLLSVASAALKAELPDSQEETKVHLVVDRLIINSHPYTIDTLHLLPDNLKPSTVYTPIKDNMLAFFSKHSPFSNFFPSPFKYQGVQYNCVEQFVASEKAKSCGDQNAVEQIMKEKDPAAQKGLCRFLQGFDRERWEIAAEEMILPALEAKFRQSKECQAALLSSGEKLIFEANPRDKFWGIGLPLHSSDIWNQDKHAGKNLLGKCLQSIRQRLREVSSDGE